VSNNRVFLIDRLLAIPLAIYFWWYRYRQKLRKHRKKNSINATNNNGVRKKNSINATNNNGVKR